MNEEDILASRIAKLRNIVQQSFIIANEQSQGFALRILGTETSFKGEESLQFDLATASRSAHYGGVPTAAYLGYGISHLQTSDLATETCNKCWEAIKRIHSRSGIALNEFVHDDVAVLGVADGLSTLNALGIVDKGFRSWLVQLIERDCVVDSCQDDYEHLRQNCLRQGGGFKPV